MNYFALKYSDNRLLAINNEWQCVYPTSDISSAFLLEAVPKNLNKIKEVQSTYKDENVSLIVVCIKPLFVKGPA